MCLDKLVGLVLFCFSYFLEKVGPWVKFRLKGNLVSCLVSAAAILPDRCHVTAVSHFPQWLWEESGTLTRVGAGQTYGLAICQHPLKVEDNFRQDSKDFAWSFLGQKPEGRGWEGSE